MVTLKMRSQMVSRHNAQGAREEVPQNPDIQSREYRFKVSAADSRKAAEIVKGCIKRALDFGESEECDPGQRAHAQWEIWLVGSRRSFYQTTALAFGLFDKVVKDAEAELAAYAPESPTSPEKKTVAQNVAAVAGKK